MPFGSSWQQVLGVACRLPWRVCLSMKGRWSLPLLQGVVAPCLSLPLWHPQLCATGAEEGLSIVPFLRILSDH